MHTASSNLKNLIFKPETASREQRTSPALNDNFPPLNNGFTVMVCHFPPHLQFLLGGLPSHPPPSWLVYKDLDALVVAWPSANISHIYLLFTSQASKRECHQSITKSHTESDTLKANSNSICSDRLLWNVLFFFFFTFRRYCASSREN